MENKKSQNFKFTVFTPTYNRSHLLPRAYESLCRQSISDFEWVIVDDGSTDGTRELVKNWSEIASFPIRYLWQENAGKHVAINRGVELARGEFFLILDSDDWLTDETLERMLYHWGTISHELNSFFAGITGLCADRDGRLVGGSFVRSPLDSNAIEIRTRYGNRDEHCGMVRTDVIRQFPFPEDLGRFVTESLVWNRIAKAYKLRFVNEIFLKKEYQEGGLTDRSVQTRVNSSRAARLYYQESLGSGLALPWMSLLRGYANYVRFSLHAGYSLTDQSKCIPSAFLWLLALPAGVAAFYKDRKSLRRPTGSH